MMKKIIFASQDPSSGNIVAVLVKRIKEDYLILASKESKSIYRHEGISCIDTDIIQDIEKFFVEFKPDLVITGASMGDTVERKAVIIAKKRKIHSISILDFWVNYVERYSDLTTGENFVYLPDYIFVMDKMAYEDMVQLGFPKEKLIITGNPHFDSFIEQEGTGKGWLYVSNPDTIVKEGVVEYFFNPIALNDLIEFLDGKERLLVRPHPKDDIQNFKDLIKGKKNIFIDAESPISELLKSHKIVVGMYTTILLQAALYKKITIHYMPNTLPQEDDFICKRLGLCHSFYDKDHFFEGLSLIQNGKIQPKKEVVELKRDATETVIKEMERILYGAQTN